MSTALTTLRLEARILTLRGQRVMIDADLAELYGVPTRALNQAVKRNASRFPPDFMFQLTVAEKAEVITNCDHLRNLKFSKSLPFAFTEHGAIQAANVLASVQAVEMGIYVVRAFVQMRQASALHADLPGAWWNWRSAPAGWKRSTACSAPTHAGSFGSCWMPCAS